MVQDPHFLPLRDRLYPMIHAVAQQPPAPKCELRSPEHVHREMWGSARKPSQEGQLGV